MNTQDPSTPPETPPRQRRRRIGLVIVNTGNGKGKTTAALGVIFRAWGRDFKVKMFQFIKHTGARFGENRAAAKLGISMESFGDGFTWLSRDMDQTAEMAVAQWDRCKKAILEGQEDIIVLDEFTYPMCYGWVPIAQARPVGWWSPMQHRIPYESGSSLLW